MADEAPILDIRADVLQGPTRLDVATVGAWMLWPDDAAMRERARRAEAVRMAIELQPRLSLSPPTPAEVQFYAETIRQAPSTEALSDHIADGFRAGIIAGHILRSGLGFGTDGQIGGLEAVKAAIAQRFGPAERLSAKTISQTIWPRFRRVAHFWAAHIQGGFVPVPCLPRDLGKFLALAAVFRERGIATRATAKAPGTILDGAEAFRLPPGLALPHVRVD